MGRDETGHQGVHTSMHPLHCIKNLRALPPSIPQRITWRKPNEVVHVDFIYMGPAEESNLKYMLLVRSDISFYTWSFPSVEADSDAATNAISKWISCFGCRDWLGTDQETHFRATLMRRLESEMFIGHPFTTLSCP